MSTKTWYYHYDTELKVFHTSVNCTGAKIAVKYHYLKDFRLLDGDQHKAQEMDQMGKPCQICVKREIRTAKSKRDYTIPPGFRKAA